LYVTNRNYLLTQLEELKRKEVQDDGLEQIIAAPLQVVAGEGIVD